MYSVTLIDLLFNFSWDKFMLIFSFFCLKKLLLYFRKTADHYFEPLLLSWVLPGLRALLPLPHAWHRPGTALSACELPQGTQVPVVPLPACQLPQGTQVPVVPLPACQLPQDTQVPVFPLTILPTSSRSQVTCSSSLVSLPTFGVFPLFRYLELTLCLRTFVGLSVNCSTSTSPTSLSIANFLRALIYL